MIFFLFLLYRQCTISHFSLHFFPNNIANGPSQALYADSIPQGKRSEMLTWLYTCYLLSSSTGPIVSIILLLTVSSHSENWSIEEIFPVFFVGILLEIPSAVIMFFFSDDYVIHEQQTSTTSSSSTRTITTTSPLQEAGQESSSSSSESEELVNVEITTEQSSHNRQSQRSSSCCPCNKKFLMLTNKACVPYVVFISGLVVSLGSGASVKYFPLFFKELGLKQAAVQAIYLVMPLFISGLSFVAQRTSRTLGRIETTILFYIFGTSLLYYLTYLSQSIPSSSNSHDHGDDDDGSNSTATRNMIWRNDENEDTLEDDHHSVPSLWEDNPHRVIWIVIIWWLRTGIMNSVYPLLESILMDVVPSNQRARWKSLESIAAFGWTGSALVGGILSDSHSYQFTFVTTATMQLIGAFLLIPIQPLVEMERSIEEEQEQAATAMTTTISDDNDNDPETTVPSPKPQQDNDDDLANGISLHQPLLRNDIVTDPSSP